MKLKHIQLITIIMLSKIGDILQMTIKNKLNEINLLKHDHSYSIDIANKYNKNKHQIIDYNDGVDESNELQNITVKFKNTCSYFLPSCLCSFDSYTRLHVLYCNDPNLKRIPNFKSTLNKNLFFNFTDLVFSKVDFSHSGIKRINKNDLAYLNLKLFTKKNSSNPTEGYLKELSSHILYHLDFENIIEIEDGSFDEFSKRNLINSNNLSSILRIRFSNSHFNFVHSNRKPFRGLNAMKLHLNNISNEYLTNTVFDDSVISELLIENMINFIGFVDTNSLPTGKVSKRFIAVRSYRIDSLCSHSLPSFVDQETFTEIIIRKCNTLQMIKPFTFFKYPHLRELVLSYNNFSQIQRNSFSGLAQLVSLDLSFNPIVSIEDYSFKDLSSLKRLNLETTLIKLIGQYTLNGLIYLQELKLTRSNLLTWIDGRAFDYFKNSLKELNLKETNVSLIDSIYSDDVQVPYIRLNNWVNRPVWLDGLNLTSLNIESFVSYRDFQSKNDTTTMCKLMRYLSSKTIVNLYRNQTCNCLIYLLFRHKHFATRFDWEHKAPVCYRSQIKYIANGSKSFEQLIENEAKCHLDLIETNCFEMPKTKTTMVTKKNIQHFATLAKTKATTLPKLDFKKLFKVIAVIILVTIFSIFCTIFLLRYSNSNKKRKKAKHIAKMNQAKSKQVKLMMPPSSLPKIDSSLFESKNKKSSSNISRLVVS